MAIKLDELEDRVLQAMRERFMKPGPLAQFCEARTRVVNERAIAKSAHAAGKGLALTNRCCLRMVERRIRKIPRLRKRSTL